MRRSRSKIAGWSTLLLSTLVPHAASAETDLIGGRERAPNSLSAPADSSAGRPSSVPPVPAAGEPAPQQLLSNRGRHRVAAGYKVGNGLGYLGGDLEISPMAHLELDLQMSWFSEKYGASGFGAAPSVRVLLLDDGRSTPYVSAGYLYFRLMFDNNTRGAGDGVFANLGYEWKWRGGLGIVVGAGVVYFRDVRAEDPRISIIGADGTRPNIEAGLRYWFL